MTAAEAEAENKIPCKFCVHDYDSHNPDAADEQRNMPCSECPDGICRYRGAVIENPAETMRRAAALMRERAEAVQHFTSPWHTAGPAKRGEWRDQVDEWRVMYATDHPAAGLIATTPDYGTFCLPDHIASWHPAGALAVADWLDAEARASEVYEGTTADEALKVARAYLGETETEHG